METKETSILDVLKGQESVKMEHNFTVDTKIIWTIAASIAVSMLTVYLIKTAIG